MKGKILLDNQDVYSPNVNPVVARQRIGMVFQKPNPFPNISIYDNVIAGLKLQGIRARSILDPIVERTLKVVGLWKEVKDDLKRRGKELSGGQQQRLCIARAIAVEPGVVLIRWL